jgi:hypothetical protein
VSGNCTEYTTDGGDDDPRARCHCPVCKGFLKWEEKDGELIPICNKCHTLLTTIPDPESDEEVEWGRICVLKEDSA